MSRDDADLSSVKPEAEIPPLSFNLHVPQAVDVAEGDDDIESLFPHTPRGDSSWFDAAPSAELIEQCLRPGHCCVPEGEVRDWMRRRLAQLGHAFNEGTNYLMAHTLFECAYAANSSVIDLISAANMRLKLGQWALVEQLYQQILSMELNDMQREVAERKMEEVAALRAGSAPHPGCNRPSPGDPNAELVSLLTAAPMVVLSLSTETERARLLLLLRTCGFAANAAGDFEAAQNWFDCSFAISGGLSDLLSAANMRIKLSAVSPFASAAYEHTISSADATASEHDMAQRKLLTMKTKLAAEGNDADAGHVTYRANA